MESLDKEQTNKLNSQITNKNKVKCQRVSNYLGSDGIKNTLTNGAFSHFNGKKSINFKDTGKINNRSKSDLCELSSTRSNRKFYDTYFTNNQGFYR